jgi:hypothetical protein
LLLGARGSGEAGPGSVNWQNGSSKDNYGYGPDIWNTFQRIKSDIGTQRTFQETSVIYAADSVNILKQNPFTYPAKYFRDLAAGVTWTMNYLQQQAQACPDQQIVLAGFSQGAMVMHRVVQMLSDTSADQPILTRLAAAVLIGDGDQQPLDNETDFGSALAATDEGIGQWYGVSPPGTFNSGLSSVVERVCNLGDVVCDYGTAEALSLPGILAGITIHLSYAKSTPLRNAANKAAANVLALNYTGGTLNVTGTVGTPISASATVTGGVLPVTVLPGIDPIPSWLSLGVGGGGGVTDVTLGGTPTNGGSWTFSVAVEDNNGNEVSIPVSLTVTGGVQPGPKNSILLYGDNDPTDNDPSGMSNLADILTAAGYTVTSMPGVTSLPSDLSSYGQIWHYGIEDAPSATDEQTLESFVQAGGSVFLTGEWGDASNWDNQADADIINALVPTGPVSVANDTDLGAGLPVNPTVIDGAAQTPNGLTTWTGSDVGGLTGVPAANTFVTNSYGDATGALWDNLGTGDGRLAVLMDINWAQTSFEDPTTMPQVTQNLAYFLSN